MAETDKDSKTEEPTEKKISDAVEKGNIPRSREVPIFASLMGVLLSLAYLVKDGSAELMEAMTVIFDNPAAINFTTGSEASQLLMALSLEAGKMILPVVAVLAVAGIAAGTFEHAPRLTLEQIRPKWSRISPSAGWKRLFGAQGLVEFGKALAKFLIIGVVCFMVVNGRRDEIVNAILADPMSLPDLALSLTIHMLGAVCAAVAVLVVADLVWTRFRWRSDLRMTRQELKDEFKQSDGDPLVKSRMRSLARDRARKRMIADVPRATVVIVNPTHYSIALRYDRNDGGAPMVLAKGTDLIALKIREIAALHNVPIIEDKPLARAMYAVVEVGQTISPEFYRAVAKIIYFVTQRTQHARP